MVTESIDGNVVGAVHRSSASGGETVFDSAYTAPAGAPTAAYTQTFSTASRTHAARVATALTDNTTGTADTTLEALTSGTVYATDVAAIRNNFADLSAAVNNLITDVASTAKVVNQLVDDMQTLGFVG